MYCIDNTLLYIVKKVKKGLKKVKTSICIERLMHQAPLTHNLRTAASRGLRCYCTPLVVLRYDIW